MSLIDLKANEPQPETIALLEKMLEKARSGELRTAVIVCGWNQDGWTTNWSIDSRSSRRRLLGQISLMQYEVLTRVAIDNADSVLAKALMGMQP